MNLSPQQVAYILSLIEHKNFGKAAEACFVTQPTLSMQVKKAEESLGQILFNRNRNPLELTVFGKKLAPILYDLQSEYTKIERLTKAEKGVFREEIRIGVIPTVAAYLIPTLFQAQKNFNPTTKWAFVELKSEDLLEQLSAKKIDLGIMAGPMENEFLYTEPLYNEEMLIYSNEWNGRKQVSLEELKDKQPWLLSSGNCLRTQMLHFCKLGEEHENQWNYEGGNLSLLMEMADKYGGYTLLPEFFAQQQRLPSSKVNHISVENSSLAPARSIIALCAHKQKNHPDLRALLQFIKMTYANKTMKKFEVLSWR